MKDKYYITFTYGEGLFSSLVLEMDGVTEASLNDATNQISQYLRDRYVLGSHSVTIINLIKLDR